MDLLLLRWECRLFNVAGSILGYFASAIDSFFDGADCHSFREETFEAVVTFPSLSKITYKKLK